MQQLEAAATAEDAVCAFIEKLSLDIIEFKSELDRRLAQASERGVLIEVCQKILRFLKMKLMQCGAVFQTHHDLLDQTGRTSYLFQLTDVQDDIAQCVETIDLLVEVSQ